MPHCQLALIDCLDDYPIGNPLTRGKATAVILHNPTNKVRIKLISSGSAKWDDNCVVEIVKDFIVEPFDEFFQLFLLRFFGNLFQNQRSCGQPWNIFLWFVEQLFIAHADDDLLFEIVDEFFQLFVSFFHQHSECLQIPQDLQSSYQYQSTKSLVFGGFIDQHSAHWTTFFLHGDIHQLRNIKFNFMGGWVIDTVDQSIDEPVIAKLLMDVFE